MERTTQNLENHFENIYKFEKLLINVWIHKKYIAQALWVTYDVLWYSLDEWNKKFDYSKLFEIQDFIIANKHQFIWTPKENSEIFLYLWNNK